MLTDTPDNLCAVTFRITLETIPVGDRLVVEGYNTRYLFDSLRRSPHLVMFAGYRLCDSHREGGNTYRATIEIVS